MKITKGYSGPDGRPQHGAYRLGAAPLVRFPHRHIEPVSAGPLVVPAPSIAPPPEPSLDDLTDVPPEFTGVPIILFSSVNVLAGQTVPFQTEALRNPTDNWIEINEIRISAYTATAHSGATFAAGSILALSLARDDQALTKDFVPLSLLSDTELYGSETGQNNNYYYTRRVALPAPILLAPNQALSAAIRHQGLFNSTNSCVVGMTLHGRTRPDYKTGTDRLPFFAGFQFAPQAFNAPLGPFYSTEADLQNTTSDSVHLTRLTGVITVFANVLVTIIDRPPSYYVQESSDTYFLGTPNDGFSPEQSIQIGATARNGYPVIPQATPWLMAFPKNGFAWSINNAVLSPKDYLALEMNVASYANLVENNNRQFMCGVGMTGWREVTQ